MGPKDLYWQQRARVFARVFERVGEATNTPELESPCRFGIQVTYEETGGRPRRILIDTQWFMPKTDLEKQRVLIHEGVHVEEGLRGQKVVELEILAEYRALVDKYGDLNSRTIERVIFDPVNSGANAYVARNAIRAKVYSERRAYLQEYEFLAHRNAISMRGSVDHREQEHRQLNSEVTKARDLGILISGNRVSQNALCRQVVHSHVKVLQPWLYLSLEVLDELQRGRRERQHGWEQGKTDPQDLQWIWL